MKPPCGRGTCEVQQKSEVCGKLTRYPELRQVRATLPLPPLLQVAESRAKRLPESAELKTFKAKEVIESPVVADDGTSYVVGAPNPKTSGDAELRSGDGVPRLHGCDTDPFAMSDP